jgi:hypothetical protein
MQSILLRISQEGFNAFHSSRRQSWRCKRIFCNRDGLRLDAHLFTLGLNWNARRESVSLEKWREHPARQRMRRVCVCVCVCAGGRDGAHIILYRVSRKMIDV